MERKLTQTVLRLLELYIKQRDGYDVTIHSYDLDKNEIDIHSNDRFLKSVPQLEFNLFMIQNTAK